MTTALNTKIVKETFDKAYNEEQFKLFIRDLLVGANFGKEQMIQPLPSEYKDFIRSAKRICKYEYESSEFADTKVLDVLVVKLKKTSSIDRARTAQRNFIARYLNGSRNYQKDAALVAFISEDEDGKISPDWRFSFVQMNYVTKFVETANGKKKLKTETELTPAKRFSFLVGENEDTHTAQSQFKTCLDKSSKGERITIEDLVQAFDIEKVSKEFFEKYKNLYIKMRDELERLCNVDTKVRDDFATHNVNIDDFAKKTLGQLVFLYFIQKKGWLGVEADKDWGSGDKKFLRNVFDKKYGNYNNFFNDILEHLFYEALASDRGPSAWFKNLNCRIPFLNGGLFEPVNGYEYQKTDLTIDNQIFQDIFDTFDLYNFTVKEDEPLEKEVAIDPEMLGKVFENLLPENIRKGNGAFYTPREIVHYMCQESLINYIYNKVNIKEVSLTLEEREQQLKLLKTKKEKEQLKLTHEVIEEIISKQDIEHLIKKGGSNYSNRNVKEEMPSGIVQNARTLDNALAEIKVCDPAIGSGAFPVGMMNEIVRARTTLSTYLNQPDRPVYEFKRNAIENSIYGVDLDAGAVDIAKLRFWLSLVVDEEDVKNIKPLPNLDYKIMQGNSLITCYEGIDFDEIVDEYKPNTQLTINLWGDKSQDLKLKLKNKQSEFLKTPYATRKVELKHEIEDTILELVREKLEVSAKEGKINLCEMEEKIRTFAQNTANRTFFPWKLFFSDAFDSGGFDIVIGNPPYIDSETMVNEGLQDVREYIVKNYNWTRGNWDIYIAFFEKGFSILKKSGNLIFITPDKWLARPFGEMMRKNISTNIASMLFAGRDIFESALVDSIITNILKNKNLVEGINVRKFDNKIVNFIHNINVSNLLSPYTLDFIASENITTINKIEEQKHRLIELCECQSACATSDAYKLKPIMKSLNNEEEYNEIFLKAINTGTIGKYYSRWATTKIKYLKDDYYFPVVTKEEFYKNFTNSYSSKTGKPKLIIKGLTLLHSYLDEEGQYIPCKSTLVIQDEDVDKLKIIMAILNSKVSIGYIKEKYASASYNGGISFNKDMINNLPIPNLSKIDKTKITNLVDSILDITQKVNIEDDETQRSVVHNYEDQINLILYKTYDLEYSQVKTIDPEFLMSENQYNDYQL